MSSCRRSSAPLRWQILALIPAVVLAVPLAAGAQPTDVFINEIHYDNAGTDVGEAIEIAGPAGTDLAGWSLVLYNGNGGAAYNTTTLSGILPGQQGGFGTLFFSYPTNGIQNGSPDGVALVDAGSIVVEFLSYEGTFVAADGPAAGMTSVDIGVAESFTTAIGESLQRIGTGSNAAQFTWTGPVTDSFGFPNAGQTFSSGGVDPVINEFVANHTGADTEAFVEVFGSPSTDYSAFTVLEIEGDGSGAGTIDAVLQVGTTNPGGYWIDPEDMENGTLTILLVENFAGSLFSDLDTNNDGVFDSTPWDRIVDDVATTDGGGSDRTYSATVLAPFFDGNPFGAGGASRIPNGGDSNAVADWVRNDFDGAGFPGFPGTPEPGEALNTPDALNELVPTAVAAVVINEILQNPSAVSDSDGEWFELFNAGSSGVDIDGWTIQDNDFDSHVIANGGPLVIPAGGFLVLAREANSAFNGGVAVDYQYSGIFLGNGSDELVLLDGGLNEVDRVEWDNGATFPDPNGASMSLIDPSLDNNIGGNWCTASTPFGDGDRGTPGAANDCGSLPLVINEIDYDQPGADTAEFVEIKNVGASSVDLTGVELVLVNGSGGGAAVYATIALPAVSLGADDYFVVCSDASTVAECDLEAISSIQNGSPDAVALRFGGAAIVDSVSYEGDTGGPYTEGSGVGLEDSGASGQDFRGISRLPDGADTDQNNVDLANACITPGRANTSLTTGCTDLAPVVEIFQIQGSGAATPFAGQTVRTVDNAVTAVGLDGFFIQTPAARTDLDPDTSDGIFVFTGGAPGVAVGDEVDVTGLASEFFDFSELSGFPLVTVTGTATVPAPVTFDAAVPSPDPLAPSCAIEFECYEGMLVEIADGTVTGPNQRFGTDPIAEVHITAAPARTFREPGVEFPGLGMPPIPTWDGNPEVFELDPDKLGLANQIIPAGSGFSATGVLGFEFGGYELWPLALSVDPATLPVPVRPRDPGELTVATLNLFRLFDDVDDPPDADGRDDTVVSTAEYQRRLDKLCAYIDGVLDAPDILAVQEAESLKVLQDLADHLASDADCGAFIGYTPHLLEGNDFGTIDVGFLTRDRIQVGSLTQIDKGLTFIDPTEGDADIVHDRPPLLLEGSCQLEFGSYPIAVMVVHNRSLGSIDDSVRGPFVRFKRYFQAESIAAEVQAIQDADPDVRLVVLGDFNAFEFSDGYADTVGFVKGDWDPAQSFVCSELACDPDPVQPDLADRVLDLAAAERYSFVFRGSGQILDHALTSQGLAAEVSGVEFGRGNADAAFDLISDDSAANLPLRASDHDGLVVYLVKDEDADGVPNDDDLCPGTVIPEGVPIVRLGVNRWALTDGDGIFDTVRPGGGGPAIGFTIGDTAGCSCEQIIIAQGLGKGHAKFGCSTGEMREWVALVNP